MKTPSPERATKEEILRQSKVFNQLNYLSKFLDAIPSYIMVLNEERQVVFYNQSLLKLLGVKNGKSVCGKRPGELLDCTNSHREELAAAPLISAGLAVQ